MSGTSSLATAASSRTAVAKRGPSPWASGQPGIEGSVEARHEGVQTFAQPKLQIVQPFQDAAIPYVKQSFVFGNVIPSTSTLMINGVEVKPYTNGGFFTMIPFHPGKFMIEALAVSGVELTTVTRSVNVDAAPVPLPENFADVLPTFPHGRQVVRPGDTLDIGFQGAPGGEAHYHFALVGQRWLPMVELPPASGNYRTTYLVRAGDRFEGIRNTYILLRQDLCGGKEDILEAWVWRALGVNKIQVY